jgi:hypothetical protein
MVGMKGTKARQTLPEPPAQGILDGETITLWLSDEISVELGGDVTPEKARRWVGSLRQLQADGKAREINLSISPTQYDIYITDADESDDPMIVSLTRTPETSAECDAIFRSLIDESKKPAHTGEKHGGTVGDETAILHAASDMLSRIYPRERVERALEDLAANAARETTSRSATATPRLQWERDRMADENPAHFAARAGYEHRGMIYSEDRELHRRLNSWLRSHDWPEGVRYVPTLPEWNTRQLVKLGKDDAREALRLDAVARRRAARHKAHSSPM